MFNEVYKKILLYVTSATRSHKRSVPQACSNMLCSLSLPRSSRPQRVSRQGTNYVTTGTLALRFGRVLYYKTPGYMVADILTWRVFFRYDSEYEIIRTEGGFQRWYSGSNASKSENNEIGNEFIQ